MLLAIIEVCNNLPSTNLLMFLEKVGNLENTTEEDKAREVRNRVRAFLNNYRNTEDGSGNTNRNEYLTLPERTHL